MTNIHSLRAPVAWSQAFDKYKAAAGRDLHFYNTLLTKGCNDGVLKRIIYEVAGADQAVRKQRQAKMATAQRKLLKALNLSAKCTGAWKDAATEIRAVFGENPSVVWAAQAGHIYSLVERWTSTESPGLLKSISELSNVKRFGAGGGTMKRRGHIVASTFISYEGVALLSAYVTRATSTNLTPNQIAHLIQAGHFARGKPIDVFADQVRKGLTAFTNNPLNLAALIIVDQNASALMEAKSLS